ncbi:flocculation protein FLO11 [Galendromus occidentalis]|uniref:Flocculation protein FLO11 n=1 Tax=Galendromus occidentalis TaxID=34638 RepID=A0AAJ7L599_9ACAR|nr:flocculation protein FLO11 [Galendromus occidentalis]
MKPYCVLLALSLVCPGGQSMFLPSFSAGSGFFFRGNGASTHGAPSPPEPPSFLHTQSFGPNVQMMPVIVGTESELQEVHRRFPYLRNTFRFAPTAQIGGSRVEMQLQMPRVPMLQRFVSPVTDILDLGMPWGRQSHQGNQYGAIKSQTKHVGAYAQPVEEPEAPAPAYGKPAPSYAKPSTSYGKPLPKPTASYGLPAPKPVSSYSVPEPSYPAIRPKPASNYATSAPSNYPQPEPSSAYGKPDQPIEEEAQAVPEASDLPSVNEGASSNWVPEAPSNEESVFTQETNHTTVSESTSSSSSTTTITETVSIESPSGDSETVSSSSSDSTSGTSNPSSASGSDSDSVLQTVDVQPGQGQQSNTDFFAPKIPTTQSGSDFTSDNVIRPNSRPPTSPSQASDSENAVDTFGENVPSPSGQNEDGSVSQVASVHQNVDQGSEPSAPFTSDNVIRPASRPVAEHSGMSQIAAPDSGSVSQDAVIEQNADISAQPIDHSASFDNASETETSESQTSSESHVSETNTTTVVEHAVDTISETSAPSEKTIPTDSSHEEVATATPALPSDASAANSSDLSVNETEPQSSADETETSPSSSEESSPTTTKDQSIVDALPEATPAVEAPAIRS